METFVRCVSCSELGCDGKDGEGDAFWRNAVSGDVFG